MQMVGTGDGGYGYTDGWGPDVCAEVTSSYMYIYYQEYGILL